MGTSVINCPMSSPSLQKDCLENVMSYLGSKKDLFIFILNGSRTNTGVTNVIVEKRRIVQNITPTFVTPAFVLGPVKDIFQHG